MKTLKVSLDGGLTFTEAPEGVRVVVEKIDVPGEDGKGELHCNFTHEGVVTDVWVTRDEALDHNIGTRSQMYEDTAADLVAEGA